MAYFSGRGMVLPSDLYSGDPINFGWDAKCLLHAPLLPRLIKQWESFRRQSCSRFRE